MRVFQIPSLSASRNTFPTLGGHLVLLILTPFAFALGAIGGMLALALGVCAAGWWNTRRHLALLRDAPRFGIADAPSGYAEVHGHAESLDNRPLRDPITREPCLWFGIETYELHFTERRIDPTHLNRSWRLVRQACSSRDFAIRDETGVCRVRVAGAHMALAQSETFPSGSYFRHVLWRIHSGDAVFVRGDVALAPDRNRQVSEPGDTGRYVVADYSLDQVETDLGKTAARYVIAFIVSAILLLGWLVTRGPLK